MAKKKSLFSRIIIIGVVLANIIFTCVVLKIFLKTSSEPQVLITSWFAFTTVEVWSLASIKKTKVNNENGGNSDG